jgi:hypothetical protein
MNEFHQFSHFFSRIAPHFHDKSRRLWPHRGKTDMVSRREIGSSPTATIAWLA